MERWVGKTAVVTGASAGIGAAICVTLADAGLRVVGLARRPLLVDELKSKVTGHGSVVSRQCDIAKPEEVAVAFRWVETTLGGTDVLVNNAGLFIRKNITGFGDNAMTDEDISSVIDVNLRGMILCTRHAVASMKTRGFDGHVVNINSIAGHYIPSFSDFNVYPSTKYAVTAFSASLANELAHFKNKIKITSLSPGLVATELAADALPIVDYAPLKPQDVADAVLYVVSTPPHVNITELTIQPIAEKKM